MQDWMPTLSRGSHREGDGHACVMEYVSVIAGVDWSDWPMCTNRVLSGVAQATNDLLEDEDRARIMLPYVHRLAAANDNTLAEQQRLAHLVEEYTRHECWCDQVEAENHEFGHHAANMALLYNQNNGKSLVPLLDLVLDAYEVTHGESTVLPEATLVAAYDLIGGRA